MKALLARSLALVAFALPAAANAQNATHNWTGFYAGLHAGGAWGNGEADVVCDDTTSPLFPFFCVVAAPTGVPIPHYSYDLSGFIGGAQAGYNLQTGNLVLGVEADISGSGVDGSDSRNLVTAQVESSVAHELEWLGTVRGRLGFATGNWLFYATGGLAFGDVDYRYSIEGGGDFAKASASKTELGWVIGGGGEVALGNFSIKGEYLYFDLGDEDLQAEVVDNVVGPSRIFFNSDFETQGHIARIGFNYHFQP